MILIKLFGETVIHVVSKIASVKEIKNHILLI
jgi:hypothetical protein